jgi:two-component system chemotaxis response regulator CheB
MDINMPVMNGLEATRRIMETVPIPIVIVSGSSESSEVTTAFEAIQAGAVAVMARPFGIGHPSHEATARKLVQTVQLMSEVKVIRRWHRTPPAIPTADTRAATPPMPLPRPAQSDIRLIAVGASTGGPMAIQTLLAGLPRGLPVPMLIVQHIASGFVHGFVDWLNSSSPLPVRVAAHKMRLQPGHIYVAPDDMQMGVDSQGVIAIRNDPPENNLRPCVSYLFRSVASVYGDHAIGVLLSGMGRDGAYELALLKEKGSITIAQDQASSVVYGMPGEAVALGAAQYVLPPGQIADLLARLVSGK